MDTTQYISESEAMQRQAQMQRPAPQPAYDLYSDQEREVPMGYQQSQQPKYLPYKNLNSSKMPREILESFMQTPAIDPTQPLGMETLFEKVRGGQPQPAQQPQQRRAAEPIVEYRTQQPPVVENKSNMDMHLLEYVIKKTVEETLKQVQEQTNINENIQIKIGDKTFGGKISTLKKIK